MLDRLRRVARGFSVSLASRGPRTVRRESVPDLSVSRGRGLIFLEGGGEDSVHRRCSLAACVARPRLARRDRLTSEITCGGFAWRIEQETWRKGRHRPTLSTTLRSSLFPVSGLSLIRELLRQLSAATGSPMNCFCISHRGARDLKQAIWCLTRGAVPSLCSERSILRPWATCRSSHTVRERFLSMMWEFFWCKALPGYGVLWLSIQQQYEMAQSHRAG